MIEEKILKMLNGDKEMATLGLVILFDRGEKWLSINIPSYGHQHLESDPMINVTPNKVFVRREEVGCKLNNGYLDFRNMCSFFEDKEQFEEI